MGDIPIDWEQIDGILPGDGIGTGACILRCFKNHLQGGDSTTSVRTDGGVNDPSSETDDPSADTEGGAEGTDSSDSMDEQPETPSPPSPDGQDTSEESLADWLTDDQMQLVMCIGICYASDGEI